MAGPVDLRQQPESTRRTIYDFVDRANIADVLINFDFATPDMVTGMRHMTTVPQQALFLMNSPMVIELARRLVAMPEFVDREDDTDRLNFLYERIYQRPPSAEETELGLEFVNQTPVREDIGNRRAAAGDEKPESSRQTPVCRAGQKTRAADFLGGIRPGLAASQ